MGDFHHLIAYTSIYCLYCLHPIPPQFCLNTTFYYLCFFNASPISLYPSQPNPIFRVQWSWFMPSKFETLLVAMSETWSLPPFLQSLFQIKLQRKNLHLLDQRHCEGKSSPMNVVTNWKHTLLFNRRGPWKDVIYQITFEHVFYSLVYHNVEYIILIDKYI